MSNGANPGHPDLPAPQRGVGKGVIIGFALQLLIVPAALVAMRFPTMVPQLIVAAMVFGIAVAQLVYIVPAVLYFRKRGQHETVKGLWIAASIVALLNASCWGLLYGGAIRVGG